MPNPLEYALAQTLAYGDVFDYAMTSAEVHRYLIGLSAPPESVRAALGVASAPGGWVERTGSFYTLRGRSLLAEMRIARSHEAAKLWPAALKFGRHVGRLPFVRMVGVTGSLAVDNVAGRADIDYLVITRPGRMWLCRAFLVLLVRVPAAALGYKICFNYLLALAEESLSLDDRNIYAAHELAQMVPLSGRRAYEVFRKENSWVLDFLPNASGPPARSQVSEQRGLTSIIHAGSGAAMAAELLLTLPMFDRLERWEMKNKIRRMRHRGASDEAMFGPAVFKGHFDSHQKRTLKAFDSRLSDLIRALEREGEQIQAASPAPRRLRLHPFREGKG